LPDLASETEPLAHLAGAMAHELNNIFTAVTGSLWLLENDNRGAEDQAAIVREILRASERGVALTSKLQAFAGRQPLQLKTIDLNETVSRALRKVILARSARIHTKLCPVKMIVLGDEEKLINLIEELVHNSCAAMPPQGGSISVETELRSEGARSLCWLCVEDNGCGMAPEVARKAAAPLFTTASHNINKGWGLSSCTGIVRQLRGRITLSSEPTRGTKVEILLPVVRSG